MKTTKGNQGFTLLEILIALLVLALAGTALLKVAGSSLLGVAHLQRLSIAQWVASNQLVEANLDPSWPPKKRSGSTEMAGREWYWRQSILATEDKNMRAITIEVRENEKDNNSITSLMTYVSNPKAEK